MKILVYCPLNPSYPRLWGRTVQSIFRLEWDKPLDWMFSANDNPHKQPYENVTHNYNRARARVLEGGYDALLTIESDMIVPDFALRALVQADVDVAYGLYVWRHGRRKWSAYSEIGETAGKSVSDNAEYARSIWGQIIPVEGVGLGCTLIYRDVLEAVPFRLYAEDDILRTTDGEYRLDKHKAFCCDWLFALDCLEIGAIQKCNTAVVCGHCSYQPWPQIIWPDPQQEKLYRIESLEIPKIVEPGEKMTFHAGMGTQIIYAAQEME